MLKAANLALRFALELCALAALAYWGWHTGGSTLVKIVLAVAAPLAAAAVWGRFASPNTRGRVAEPVRIAAQAATFGAAVAALLAAGRPVLAAVSAVAAAVNAMLLRVLGGAP
jgi:hypothetical protein